MSNGKCINCMNYVGGKCEVMRYIHGGCKKIERETAEKLRGCPWFDPKDKAPKNERDPIIDLFISGRDLMIQELKMEHKALCEAHPEEKEWQEHILRKIKRLEEERV